MTRLTLLCLALLSIDSVAAAQTLEISMKRGTTAEAETKAQLQRLGKIYDLSPWFYTKQVVVDEQAIPFSHPVLTLHTRHLKDDDLLLSTFVHEQFHWFLSGRREATDAAIAELRKLFPAVPAGGRAAARDEYSTYATRRNHAANEAASPGSSRWRRATTFVIWVRCEDDKPY